MKTKTNCCSGIAHFSYLSRLSHLSRLSFGSALLVLMLVPVKAFTQERVLSNPPELLQDSDSTDYQQGVLSLATSAMSSGSSNERVLNLAVEYAESQLWNPATGQYDRVRLRSYNGTDVDPTSPFVAPTIKINPGETIRVNLDNQLPADSSCINHPSDVNIPHCFNGTNLHTHGLWINPAGNGDNVLLSINPGVQFEYEYNVPADHPSGTFWYHTHRHGSTALQVSSGMAGALIIEGDRLPTPTQNGDIDTLLGGFADLTLVMQQIQYACRTAPTPQNPNGTLKQTAQGRYYCDPGDVGVIEDYDQFGPGTWPASGRYTSINGHVLPTFTATQGEVQRWRMIHAGVRDTISLQFYKALPSRSVRDAGLLGSIEDEQSAISANCGTEPLPYTLIAADGLTLAAGAQTDIATFQPGYRYDALLVFPEAGEYCVIDASAPAAGNVNNEEVGTRMLGYVNVAAGDDIGSDIQAYLTQRLIANAQSEMPPTVRASVINDLNDDLKFSRFIPHPSVAESEVTGTQELTFYIDTSSSDVQFEVGNTLQTADVRPYDPDRIDRKLPVGSVEEWVMQSHFVSHPFHIHVNPFQVVEILDPNGRDVSAAGSVDDAGGSVDPQYAGLKGVWKDTLWIKSLAPSQQDGYYTIRVRTRYQRYIGEFVLHCHILDHEDQGMMQNVEIVLPNS